MDINKSMNDRELTQTLTGRLDTNSSPELDRELEGCYCDTDSLIMDISGLEYISSAGLRVLLSAHKKMCEKNGLKVRGANEAIMEIFEVTGFSDILDIEKA